MSYKKLEDSMLVPRWKIRRVDTKEAYYLSLDDSVLTFENIATGHRRTESLYNLAAIGGRGSLLKLRVGVHGELEQYHASKAGKISQHVSFKCRQHMKQFIDHLRADRRLLEEALRQVPVESVSPVTWRRIHKRKLCYQTACPFCNPGE